MYNVKESFCLVKTLCQNFWKIWIKLMELVLMDIEYDKKCRSDHSNTSHHFWPSYLCHYIHEAVMRGYARLGSISAVKSIGLVLGHIQLFLLAMGTSHACSLSAVPQIPSPGWNTATGAALELFALLQMFFFCEILWTLWNLILNYLSALF